MYCGISSVCDSLHAYNCASTCLFLRCIDYRTSFTVSTIVHGLFATVQDTEGLLTLVVSTFPFFPLPALSRVGCACIGHLCHATHCLSSSSSASQCDANLAPTLPHCFNPGPNSITTTPSRHFRQCTPFSSFAYADRLSHSRPFLSLLRALTTQTALRHADFAVVTAATRRGRLWSCVSCRLRTRLDATAQVGVQRRHRFQCHHLVVLRVSPGCSATGRVHCAWCAGACGRVSWAGESAGVSWIHRVCRRVYNQTTCIYVDGESVAVGRERDEWALDLPQIRQFQLCLHVSHVN